jgi:predicted dehydrogenase
MKLRGAISGFGQVAALGHLRGWRTISGVEIVAIHEPVAARRQEAMRLMPNARVYDDLGLMLGGERLDFVDIASPPAYHAHAAQMALEAGAHVLTEKPLCLSVDDLDRLAALARAKERVLFCVHNWKHAPAYRVAHELVTSGELGTLRYVGMYRLRTEQAGGAQWRLDAQVGGGGIVIDHGWHIFYLMHWLMGGHAPETISASFEIPANQGPTGAVEEVADLTLSFARGRFGYSHLSWRAPSRRTSAILYGDRATLEIEGDRALLTPCSGAPRNIEASDAPDDSYHSAWFHRLAETFVRAMAGGCDSAEAIENAAEARTALLLTIAARRSAASGGLAVRIGP